MTDKQFFYQLRDQYMLGRVNADEVVDHFTSSKLHKLVNQCSDYSWRFILRESNEQFVNGIFADIHTHLSKEPL